MRPVELTWAGGEHSFLLTIDLLRALQERCDAGPEFILDRLRTRQWRVDDVVSTIRLGLEGGGMSKEEARRLVSKHVEDRPLAMSVTVASLVLAASIYDLSGGDDPVGEAQAGEEQTNRRSPAVNGDSVVSTEPPPSSE